MGFVPIALVLHQPIVIATVLEASAFSAPVESDEKRSVLASGTATADAEPLSLDSNVLFNPQWTVSEGTLAKAIPVLGIASSETSEKALHKNTLVGSSPLIQEFLDIRAQEIPPGGDHGTVTLSPPAPTHSADNPAAIAPAESPSIPPNSVRVTAQETAPETTDTEDPELGIIRLRDPRQDPELGVVRLRDPLQDPELGILQLRPFIPEPPPRPVLFVSTYVTTSSSDNVFLVDDPIQGRISDTFIRPGFSITALPRIGPKTNLFASVETNFLRYQESRESNYDELRFRASVRHNFTNRVYGQIGWSGQLLFDEGFEDQFFTKHGVELFLGRRDTLLPGLSLDSYYQGQLFFSDPNDFSSFTQSAGIFLGYRFHPQWNIGLGYQLTLSDFIVDQRYESYQRIVGQLRYSLSPSVRMSIFGGTSYGRSSKETISFDNTFFGISIDATFKIF